ncbi:hypothetical protein NQ131_07840 [Klebsiella quasipneumoniae]|nr:hypothetical protein [Klebsiella quasipneumoniae]MDL4023161.1 hypothetical protein [Klebsiella quasipneumoniae]
MTLQAVNELIASLESAGELSIREQKFLKLAKAFKQLAAENVARKNGNGTAIEFRDFYTWWNILNEDGLRTEEERMLAAGAWMARSGLGNTEEYQYVAPETPATDRIVAWIKADGVEEFVSNTVHKIFDESGAVSALAYLSLANSHVKQLREWADK